MLGKPVKKSPLTAALPALAIVLVLPVAPVAADPLAAPLGPPPVEAAPAASSDAQGPAAFARPGPRTAAEAEPGLITDTATSQVAPGLTLTEFDRFDPGGWIRGDTLAVDLSTDGLRPTYLRRECVARPR
jgi:hypothetical protein